MNRASRRSRPKPSLTRTEKLLLPMARSVLNTESTSIRAKVCQTTVTMYQSMLLAERSDIDHIIEAVRKIHSHSAALAKA